MDLWWEIQTSCDIALDMAGGLSLGPVVERISYVGMFLPTENPTREVDLARMLKSLLQAALPGPQIELMLERVRKMEEDFAGMLARGIEIKGELSKRELAPMPLN